MLALVLYHCVKMGLRDWWKAPGAVVLSLVWKTFEWLIVWLAPVPFVRCPWHLSPRLFAAAVAYSWGENALLCAGAAAAWDDAEEVSVMALLAILGSLTTIFAIAVLIYMWHVDKLFWSSFYRRESGPSYWRKIWRLDSYNIVLPRRLDTQPCQSIRHAS